MYAEKNMHNADEPPKERHARTKVRVIVWVVVCLACVFFSLFVWLSPNRIIREYNVEFYQERGWDTAAVLPGKSVQQHFKAMGRIAGECKELHLSWFRDAEAEGDISVTLFSQDTGEILLDTKIPFNQIPLQEVFVIPLPEGTKLNSGENYCLTATNLDAVQTFHICKNSLSQSGKLVVGDEVQPGCMNLGVLRKSGYARSGLLLCMILLTDLTVLGGLALVLFRDIKEQLLYLILAIGFGIVMLFDLTPIYGFDMRFQFDSAYVVSNQMMGLGGAVETPSLQDPEKTTLSYYRRAGDDYSQYQFYYHDAVSDNYVDTAAGLGRWTASETDKELVLVETHLGFIGEQLYLYIPQAVGFTVARLLGLGLFPMLQLARIITYAVFVLLMYLAIKTAPFGRRILLVMALIPTVMTQTVSITRDAMIFGMSFYLIAKVLQVAYRDGMPKKRDWIVILAISMLLAPCKMVYLPLSFLWLLIIYRKYILDQKPNYGKVFARIAAFALPVLLFFVLTNLASISNISQTEKDSIYNTESYTVYSILMDPIHSLYVFSNTFRMELGSYLLNGIQLFDIDLGSSDGMSVLVIILLVIESCYVGRNRSRVNAPERGFFFLVAAGVLLLVSLASMQWTPTYSNVIVGLQGRYLTPVIPLVCLAAANNPVVRISESPHRFVNACCCIFPAIMLMNMYLWTITT